MKIFDDEGVVKRVRVKGHSRMTPQGKLSAVSSHYRVVKRVRTESQETIRRKRLV